MLPKSDKLKREEAREDKSQQTDESVALAEPSSSLPHGSVEIRVVDCCNDFIAILQTQIQSTIELVNDAAKYKNEGLVVGVGPGVSDGAGGRLIPCVEVGDYIMFGERNVIQKIESDSPPYQGQLVVILSERNVICKLPTKVDWVEYQGD